MAEPELLTVDDYKNAGPAFSRRSRVPIKFTSEGLGGDNGQYSTTLMSNLIAGLISKNRAGTIKVDPDTPEGIHQTIRHEDVHALMNREQLPEIPPGILTAFNRSGRAGVPETEIPAYMTAYSPGQVPEFTPDKRQIYMQAFLSNLMKSNPVLGGSLSKIAFGR